MHYVHYVHCLIVEFIVSFQARVELSIEDPVWKDTRANMLILWITSAINSALCSVLDGLRTSTRPMVPIRPEKLNLWAKNLLMLKIY